MNTVRLLVISAGLGSPSSTRRLADDLTTAAVARLDAEGVGVLVDVVEVRDLAHEAMDALITGQSSAPLQHARSLVRAADAVIVATPVHQGSYSGMFKTFVDALEPQALAGKPVLLSASGGSERHALVVDQELRPLFGFLQALPVPTGVFATAADCTTDWRPDLDLRARIARAAAELADLAMLTTRAARAQEPAA